MIKRALQKIFIYGFTILFLFILVAGIIRLRRQKDTGVTAKPTTAPQNTQNNIIVNQTQNIVVPPAPVTNTTTTTNTTQPPSSKTAHYVGETFTVRWGDVTASIDVTNGKIMAVDMPDVPDSPPSIYAAPVLIDQALKAGTANIQGVSGATYTSEAFIRSLESAIAKAGLK